MRAAILLAVAMIVAGIGSLAIAAEPTYLIVQPPGYMVTRHGGLGTYPGVGLGVNTHAYSYGWFGAKPCGPWQRHYGYTNGSRQWGWRD